MPGAAETRASGTPIEAEQVATSDPAPEPAWVSAADARSQAIRQGSASVGEGT